MIGRWLIAQAIAMAWALPALAQANPTAFEPTLGEKLGGWLPFVLILIVAIAVYRYRKRNAP